MVNQSLEFTAEKAIRQHRDCCKDCRRRVWKVLRYLLTATMCLGMPVVLLVVLVVHGSHVPLSEVRTVKVGRDGIETAGSETLPTNFTCVGNISGTVSAEPAGSTYDEGLLIDHNRETIWQSSEEPIPTLDEQHHGRELRPQHLSVELKDPIDCVQYLDVYWDGEFSAATYNISAVSVFGDIAHLQFTSADSSRDRVDAIRLQLPGLQSIQLDLLAPLLRDSVNVYSYRIRELELLGFRDALDAGDLTQPSPCARKWQSEDGTEGLINTTSDDRPHIQPGHRLVEQDSLIVLENCTSYGGPKYSWEKVIRVGISVMPWLWTVLVIMVLIKFRHSLCKCYQSMRQRFVKQHSMERATSRAHYTGRLRAIKSRTDQAILSEISKGLSVSMPIVVTQAVKSAVSTVPHDAVLAVTSPRVATVVKPIDDVRNVVYGRGTAIVNFDCLDEFLKIRILAWIECTELIKLCRVCKWWRRLYLQAGHWIQVPFASPYWAGERGRSHLARFPNLCCIELWPDRCNSEQAARAAKGFTYTMPPTSTRHHTDRASDLMQRNDADHTFSGIRSSTLNARDLELRRTLLSFRLRSEELKDDDGNSTAGCATSIDDGDTGTGVPSAVWELSDGFVQQLFSRDCKLTALDLSNSSFHCRLKQLKSVHELSLSQCHQLDVFSCDPSALASLRQLDLSSCSCLWDVNGLLNCCTVTEVDLSYCPRLENIGPLAACSKLRTLNLSHCERLREVSVLGALSALQHIDMSSTIHVDDIGPLSRCDELTTCDISWTSVVDLMPLAECEKLQLVDAQGCEGLLAEGVTELQRAGVQVSLRATTERVRQHVAGLSRCLYR